MVPIGGALGSVTKIAQQSQLGGGDQCICSLEELSSLNRKPRNNWRCKWLREKRGVNIFGGAFFVTLTRISKVVRFLLWR